MIGNSGIVHRWQIVNVQTWRTCQNDSLMSGRSRARLTPQTPLSDRSPAPRVLKLRGPKSPKSGSVIRPEKLITTQDDIADTDQDTVIGPSKRGRRGARGEDRLERGRRMKVELGQDVPEEGNTDDVNDDEDTAMSRIVETGVSSGGKTAIDGAEQGDGMDEGQGMIDRDGQSGRVLVNSSTRSAEVTWFKRISPMMMGLTPHLYPLRRRNMVLAWLTAISTQTTVKTDPMAKMKWRKSGPAAAGLVSKVPLQLRLGRDGTESGKTG